MVGRLANFNIPFWPIIYPIHPSGFSVQGIGSAKILKQT